MIKRMIILIVMGLTLSSCQLFTEAIKDNINRVEQERERKEARKKDAYAAAGNPEYEAGVELAIKDISKRSVNKRVEFGEITLLIPENTRINSKHGNIVDEKTGYGITIIFSLKKRYYITKEVNNKKYGFFYDEYNANISKIAQRIMKINDFKEPK